MPLIVSPAENPRQLTALARGKAQRECSRGDHDLRLLLAHIKILDQLEHSAAEVYERETKRKSQSTPPAAQHQEYERKRPNLHKRENAAVSRKDELDELFVPPSTISSAPALVTIEELDDDDDWDA